MADGAIIFRTELDNKGLEKELAGLKKKIQSLEDQLESDKNAMSPLVEKASKLEEQLNAAKARLYEMKNAADGVFTKNQIADQKETVAVLQSQWNNAQGQVESYDKKIQKATMELEKNKERAVEIAEQLAKVSPAAEKMAAAMVKAEKNAKRFAFRLKEVLRSALVFTLITKALSGFREWMGNVIKTSNEASAAIARLEGALLTLAQPIIEVIIPAFTAFVNVLSSLVSKIAGFVAMLFGTTAEQSAAAAESLQAEVDALNATGTAAKKAGKSLASFDEINKLSGDSACSSGGASFGGITPDFSSVTSSNWLKEALAETAGYVTTALLLGGIALVAIGAAMGSLSMVLAGLLLLGAGVAVGMDSNTFSSWADSLGLNNVFGYVVAAMQLAGIALIAIGACMANLALVVAGAVLLGVGITGEAIGEETLSDWWEVLKLTTVQQWVGAALLLTGIALIAIGACMGNIVMILAGAAFVGLGTITSASEGNLKDWVTVLGLGKVAGWVTGALLLGGIALLVIGIVTANIPMVIAGLSLLGAGVSVGLTSGTFSSWLDTISGAFVSFKNTILGIFNELWGGIQTVINCIAGGIEWMANTVINGINAAIDALNSLSFEMPDWLGGKSFGFNIDLLDNISLPRLAQGAVIPPNREFLAVLGDQKSGTNIETPLSTMVQAFKTAMQDMNTGGQNEAYLVLDDEVLGKIVYRLYNKEDRRVGVSLSTK